MALWANTTKPIWRKILGEIVSNQSEVQQFTFRHTWIFVCILLSVTLAERASCKSVFKFFALHY